MSQALNVRHTAVDHTARSNAQSNAQVKRYRPGIAPEWAKIESSEAEKDDLQQDIASEDDEPVATTVAAPVILTKACLNLVQPGS